MPIGCLPLPLAIPVCCCVPAAMVCRDRSHACTLGLGHTVNWPKKKKNHCFGTFLCLLTYLASKQSSSWRLGRREKRKGNRTLRL